MVDVGYFIDGKHGVIRNVSLTANPYSDYRVFTSTDCTEQYCMKVDDIEYIIPHEEEQMITPCQSVDKPMTYKEKFVEVFGYEPDTDKLESPCDMFNCIGVRCNECKYGHMKWHWDDEYREK